jgi:lipopolysaccharide assembly outer membrane protein LptD (OstA)
MKSLLCMAIAAAACCPLVAQDQVGDAIVSLHIFPNADGLRIDVTFSNKETLSGRAAIISRDKSVHLLNLRGDVDLTIDGMRLRADEVVIVEDSGEIKPSGNVRITTPK